MTIVIDESDRVADALPDALALVSAVRDMDQVATAEILARADAVGMAVALAAMVPVDRSAGELLAWTRSPIAAPGPAAVGMRACTLDWVDPQWWDMDVNRITADNRRALEICSACPFLRGCEKECIANPPVGQIRAAIAWPDRRTPPEETQ